jgi:hypothetical protein
MIRELPTRRYDAYHEKSMLRGMGDGVLLLAQAFDQEVGVVLDEARCHDREAGGVPDMGGVFRSNRAP